MIKKLWRKYVTQPLRLRGCADYGFKADPAMDQLCERFDESLRNMWYAKADSETAYLNGQSIQEATQTKIDELVTQQKAIQDEGGEKLKSYLDPYFKIVERHKAGEWGRRGPQTIPGGWERFRTANNWRT